MRQIALAIALIPAIAICQVFPTGNASPTPLAATTATTAAVTYYVATTGNDANDCLAVSAPCLTIDSAVKRAPHILNHPVVVQVGTGTFTAGAYVNGFMVGAAASTSAGPALTVQGTFIDATLATGSAAGTASAVTAGSGKTWGIITASGSPGWTTDDLRGKWVEWSTGRVDLIAFNTASTITFAGALLATTALPTAGATFTIREVGTIITGTLPVATAPDSTTVTGEASFHVEGPSVGVVSPTLGRILLKRFKFTGTGVTRAFHVTQDGPVLIKECRFEMTASNARAVYLTQLGSARVQSNSASLASSGAFVESATQTSTRFLLIQSNVSDGGGNWGFLQSMVTIFRSVSNSVRSLTRVYHHAGFAQGIVSFDRYATVSDICIRGDLDPSGWTYGHMDVDGADMQGCANAVIEARGPSTVAFTGASGTTGTGTVYGINVFEGARVKLASTVSITGGTADLNVDGTTSSLAALRALSPKYITNTTTLSQVYEP
jgi:hypothetical protein